MSTMGQKRRKFSPEFKREIVELVLKGRASVPELCQKHELTESSVYNWVRQAKVDHGQGPAGVLRADAVLWLFGLNC